MWPFERLTPTGRVLRRARRMIERQGWAQGRVGGVTGSGPCAAHAIVLAARKEPVDSDVVMAAFADHNELPYRRPGYSPTQRTTSWNDTLGRTEEEVLAAFRAAEAVETTSGFVLR
jgi:hypothetical protein